MKFKKYFSLIEFLFPLKDRRLILIGMLFLFLPTWVLAADFISLVGIPGVPDNGQDLNKYFNAIYRLSISLAALLAVVRIVLAGAKYMLTDIVPAKGEALEDIKGALLGLLIILGAVLILSTINYDLTHYNIKFDAVEEPPPPPPPDGIQASCDAGGGCDIVSCSDLSSYIASSIIATVAAVSLGSAAGGAAAGSFFIPILGTAAGGAMGYVSGAVVAGTVGYIAYNSAQDGQCDVACYILGGYSGESANTSCTIPKDKKAFAVAELERKNAELMTYCSQNKNTEECCFYNGGIYGPDDYENWVCRIGVVNPDLNEAIDCQAEGDSWDYINNLCRSNDLIITIDNNTQYYSLESCHSGQDILECREEISSIDPEPYNLSMVTITYNDGEIRPVTCNQITPPVCNF